MEVRASFSRPGAIARSRARSELSRARGLTRWGGRASRRSRSPGSLRGKKTRVGNRARNVNSGLAAA